MSVRPILFHEDTGDIDTYFDEQGHSGTIPAAEVKWSPNIDGSHNHNFIVLACPDGCGSVSTWPVGGGADAVQGQKMFVEKTVRDGCACGVVTPNLQNAVPEAHVHLNVSRMDGPQRWALDDAEAPALFASDKSFQVVYRKSDGLVVGTHPKGGVGNQHGVSVIHDMLEWDILMKTDPAYLSSDGDHIVSTPREEAET